MPKPRIIDPSFWEDIDIQSLSRDTRFLIVAMITAGADDHGRCKANPMYLKRLAFAFDADVSISEVAAMIEQIRKCRNIRLYEVGGEEYALFKNWQKYQNIRYPVKSKLPEPQIESCAESAKNIKTVAEISKPPMSSCSVVLGRVEQSSVDDITAPKDGADDPLPFADAESLKDDDEAQAFVEQQIRKQETAPKEKAKKPANPTFLLAVALAEVCKQDFSANQGRLLKEAKQLALAAPPATPELLRQQYNGPGCWWYRNDWRGRDKNQAPTPPAIRETWGQWQGGGKGNGHGNGGNAAESVAMRSIREYVESG